MPFTPYHFGPSGFIGLLFRKWLDIPVFVLANVVVDVEVLVIASLKLGYPLHRYWHTPLIGGVVGALWGIAVFPLRTIFRRIMSAYRLNYETGFATERPEIRHPIPTTPGIAGPATIKRTLRNLSAECMIEALGSCVCRNNG